MSYYLKLMNLNFRVIKIFGQILCILGKISITKYDIINVWYNLNNDKFLFSSI